jgi:arylsulfatase A-like enzyme
MILSLLLLLCQASSLQRAAQPSREIQATTSVAPRNVLIIILDDVAAADLAEVRALHGTPNIDALAVNGLTFTEACASATCSPSRRSLCFGRYFTEATGGTCEAFADGTEPALSEVSLGEALSSHSSAILGKWHLGGDPTGGPMECAPVIQGFDYWVAGYCGGDSYQDNWIRVDGCASSFSTEYEPIAVRDAFLAGWPATVGPKLGIFATLLAHGHFHTPPPELIPVGYPPVTFNKRVQFRAMIAAYDTIIGQILQVVNLQYTLVIVVGDNGTPQNFEPRAKTTCYERGIRVPLIMAGGPIVAGGRTCSELVHLVDIPATAADWAGQTGIPPSWDGASLLPTLLNQAHPQYHQTVICGSATPSGGNCIRSLTRKLIDRDEAQGFADELYDLAADPTELVNVIANPAYSADLADLRAQLNAFYAR